MTNRKTETEEKIVNTMPPSASHASSELGSSTTIGRRLKAYYEDVASEPIPDRFLSLLDALDAAETKTRGRGQS